jgi:hypothetical protein
MTLMTMKILQVGDATRVSGQDGAGTKTMETQKLLPPKLLSWEV